MNLFTCIRVYPGISKNPVLTGSKLETFSRCFHSFVKGLNAFNHCEILVLLDNCPKEFYNFLEEVSREFDGFNLTFRASALTGNRGTFLEQLSIALVREEDFIFILEDDYLFIDNWSQDFLNFVKTNEDEFCFYTGYRTADYKTLGFHQVLRRQFGKYGEATTTLSFITKPYVLQKTYRAFLTFTKGNFDNVLWLYITDRFGYLRVFWYFILDRRSVNLIRFLKFFWFYTHVTTFKLNVPEKSFMVHLEEAGFPEDMKVLL